MVYSFGINFRRLGRVRRRKTKEDDGDEYSPREAQHVRSVACSILVDDS